MSALQLVELSAFYCEGEVELRQHMGSEAHLSR